MQITKEQLVNICEMSREKPVMEYVCFSELGVVSTNNKSLMFNPYPEGVSIGYPKLLHHSVVNQMARIAKRNPEHTLTLKQCCLTLRYGNNMFSADFIEEDANLKFPEWTKIIPEESNIKVHLNVWELKKLIDAYFELGHNYITIGINDPKKPLLVEDSSGNIVIIQPSIKKNETES